MIITNYVDMDLQRPNTVAVVQVVQNDRYSRRIALNLYDGGAAWAIPEGVSAIIRYRKGNGKGGEYDTLPDGTLAWTAERNVLTVMLAPRVTTVVGTVSLSVLLMEGNEQIGTFSILLHVQASGWEIPDDSEDYCNVRGFLPVPAKAAVGQFFRVSAINERGQVTEVTASHRHYPSIPGAVFPGYGFSGHGLPGQGSPPPPQPPGPHVPDGRKFPAVSAADDRRARTDRRTGIQAGQY